MNFMHQFCRRFIVVLSLLTLLLPVQNAHAGAITNISVSETSLVASEISTYTFTFTPQTTINSGMWCDGAYFWFDFDDDFTVSGATLDSITPSISGMSINGRNDSNGQVRMYTTSGAIAGGQQYTVVLSGIQNPATPQTPVNHQIRTGEGCSTIDSGSIAANTIVSGATNPPAVQSQIPDKSNLEESEGVIQYVVDLNNNFLDLDGDTMTFSASSSDSSVVAVTLSGPNNRTLSIEAKKYGSATITVTATSIDGSVDDDFTVSAIGELIINSITSSSDVAGQTTDLTVNFTLETTVSDAGGDGAYLYFGLPTQYGVDDSTAITVTSPSVAGTIFRNAGASDIWFIATASTIPAGTYTATISNVTNPSSGGSFGDLELDTRDGGGTTFDIGAFALPSITGDFPWILFIPAFVAP